MIDVQARLVSLFEILVLVHAIQAMKREDDIVSLVASVIHRTHGVESRISLGIHRTLVALVNAHNPKRDVSHLGILPNHHRNIATIEFLGLVLAKNQRLTHLGVVNLIDKPTV